MTLLGRCAVPAGAAKKAAGEAYFARFPEARAHLSAHGFSPFVLRVERVRWIAGFGSMGWTERDRWEAVPAERRLGDDAEATPSRRTRRRSSSTSTATTPTRC